MLSVRDLHAWYGRSHVLQGLDFDIQRGEIVALLGRNGAGRSTTAKALMGMVQARGDVRFKGQTVLGRKVYEIARMGLGYVPESRDVFPDLTVRQNLALGRQGARSDQAWTKDDMYAFFPRLLERRDTPAGALSGGEQQMLTLCRTLMGNPDLLLVDEPTEGLAPQLIAMVSRFLQALRERATAVLLIEQKLRLALDIADRVLVMGDGQIVFAGTPAELMRDVDTRRRWLSVDSLRSLEA